MTDISIYNKDGIKIDVLSIDDYLSFVDGRVSKGDKHYYKGVGTKYVKHHIKNVTPEYTYVTKSNIFYVGYSATKICFEGKFGIFQEQFQPIYSDFIGTCGAKEGLIVSNSMGFELSSVDVLDCITFDKENSQCYFILDYSCGRQKYLNHASDPKNLRKLLDYMLQNNWNFLWDKNSISDISSNGLLSDTADIFKSNELKHQLGTVYSILYSLGNTHVEKFNEFLKYNNMMKYVDGKSFIVNAITILKQNNIDVMPFNGLSYYDIISKYLMQGKNCGHCSCDFHHEQGEVIKEQYLAQLKADFNR